MKKKLTKKELNNVSGGDWDLSIIYGTAQGIKLAGDFNRATDEKTKSDILEAVKNSNNIHIKTAFRESTGIDVDKL